MNKRIYLPSSHMGGLEMKYIKEDINTNWVASVSPNIDAFEKEICEYVGIVHGLALSSGTAAIHLKLRHLGVKQEDYVFCSNFKFMPIYEKGEPNYWLTVVTINKDCDVMPEDIITGLEKENIESRPVWKPMNMQPVFKGCLYFSEDDDYCLEQDFFRRGV